MWSQFFLENAHFALNVFGGLVMFAVAWLYFDAWMLRKSKKEGLRFLGYLLFSLSFILHATNVESAIVGSSLIAPEFHTWVTLPSRAIGYILIIISLFLDPVQPKPKTEGLGSLPEPKTKTLALFPFPFLQGVNLVLLSYPLLGAWITGLYFQRASTGLERHLYRVSLGFLLLTISELLSLRVLLLTTTNVDLYKISTAFGPIWFVEHFILFIGLVCIGRWVFGYLLKRFETQLFMIFNVTILVIFLITTVSFTGLLVKNLVDENTRQLQTDVQVLNLSIDSKKGEALSDAQVLAQDPRIIQHVEKGERREVAEITQTYLLTKKQTSLLVLGSDGQVIANGEDIERYGYSLSNDPLVKRGLLGESVSALVTSEGILAPIVSVKSVTPITKDTRILGVVISGSSIDTALFDGIKKATGLEASIYGGNTLSATTLVTADGVTRPIGTLEQNSEVKFSVLGKGIPYAGGITLLNQPYFGAFLPVMDLDNKPIGMLFVGKPQLSVFATAGRSIELTFVVTIVLLILSIIPAYGISRYITSQLK